MSLKNSWFMPDEADPHECRSVAFGPNVQTIPQTEVPETQAEPTDFFSMAGLWEGREVTLASIRQKAWPRQEQ